MIRAALLLVVMLGLALGGSAADAGRKPHHRSALVVKFMLGHRWSPNDPEIVVINHSRTAADDVNAGVGVWNLPGVPPLRVVQAEPLPCKGLRPQRGAILLCVSTDPAGGGWSTSFTNKPHRHNKRKTRKRQRYTQAAIARITDRPRNAADARNLVAHEVGHALGLRHLDCGCIMYPDLLGMVALAPEDLAALRRLYP